MAPTLDREDYEEILNLPAHLVVIISSSGTILKSNITHNRILGYEPETTYGKSLHDFIHQEDQHTAYKKFYQLVHGEEVSINLNVRCRHRDRTYRWISWTAVAKDKFIYAMGTDTTKRVEREISQKEYQTRFTTFFEQSTLPMKIYSLEGATLAVNKAWESLFESSSILEDPHVKSSPLWQYLLKAREGESIEVPAFWYDPAIMGKPGRGRWLEAWISPVKDENGTIFELAMILKDVTEKIETQQALVKSISERKAAEEKFQILSDRLSMAVRAGKIGIWEWIPNTDHVIWDETTERLFGFHLGSFPRSTEAYNDCIHPDDRKSVWTMISQALEGKKPYRIDHRIIRKDGVQRWVQASGMGLYDDHGTSYHMIGTMIDITERVEAESDQKFLSQASEFLNGYSDHREILKTLCDHAINYFCDGVFIDELGPEGKIKRLMVVHPDLNICKALLNIDEKFPYRYENNPVMRPLISGKPLFVEDSDHFWEALRRSQGDEYVESVKAIGLKSSIRVRLKGRESVLGMITFFTTKNSSKELKRRHIWLSEELAYRASMAYENALIHLNSQEAIRSRDEFLSIASHELKTPLQSLTLQNQMRKRNLQKKLMDAFGPEKIAGMIDADLRHLMRITRLIDDMLDISRIRAGKLTFMQEDVDFIPFVKDVLDRFRPQLEAVGCYMSASYCEPLTTHIDMYRIEQVIVNLLTNAMKYGAGKPIKVEVCNRNGKVQLLVHDQGPGIREEDSERIFERFERAISSYEVSGLGLGLYISRKIMEQNGGSLFVRSVFGQGSTFIMEFPIEKG